MAQEVSSSLVGKVVDLLFGVAKKEIGYMWNYTQHVEKFTNEVEHLKDMRGRVQEHIDIAKRKGDNLLYGVQEWVDKAEVEISKAEEFLEQEANAKKTCFKIGMFGNWCTLYHYGKGATKKTPPLLQHHENGKTFESCVSVDTPAPGPLDVYEKKNLDDIVTHNSALGDIIAAIEDESKQIIGIYGLGGVGKTTLAKEVAVRVKTLFADVAFTTLSKNVNFEKVHTDIGEATKRIMKGDKILIILDDVWEKLNIEELCIPCGIEHKNCKILLTSRSQDVCEKMNAQSKICVYSLPIEEAWILFKSVVGERLEADADLKPVALKLTEECGGLPLLIQAVGNALKDESLHSWNSALSRLKKHALLDIDPEIRKAFTHLQLSYDFLKSEEAKSCFLLCIPEDEGILLEKLVFYGVGMAKFDNLENMEDARQRVGDAVNILTSSGLLLLNDFDKRYTRMHDVVRDVALLIASKGENKFLVQAGKGLDEWLPRNNSLESYKGISLMRNRISKLPDYEVHLPNLDIFIISENSESPIISDDFIRGMKEVKVLDMAMNQISSLPQSLKLLTKLRMLDLEENESLHDIFILGELKDLEILILNKTGIKEIPQVIGGLVNLRRLEVMGCRNLSHIKVGVISKLWRLEDLSIEFTWVHKGVYDCCVEVMNLSKLTYLNLIVPSLDVIPEGFNSEKLKQFVIHIGCFFPIFKLPLISECFLVISIDHLKLPFLKWIKNLIEAGPNITLRLVQNLNNILPDLYNEGFNKLKFIELQDSPNVSCLVDRSISELDQRKTKEKFFMELKDLSLFNLEKLEVLFRCPEQCISLTNLVELHISWCPKLVRLLPVRVARGLVKLKSLIFGYCDGLEDVIWDGEGEHSENIIVFPSLDNIFFYNLGSLKSFYSGNCTIKYPSLVKVRVEYCFNMKTWGPGIHETPKLKFVDDVPILDGPSAFNDAVAKSSEAWRKRDEEDEKQYEKDEGNDNDDEDTEDGANYEDHE